MLALFHALAPGVGASVFAKFDELGISIVDADPTLENAFREAAKPITAKWIADAGPNGAEALAFYQQRVKELSK